MLFRSAKYFRPSGEPITQSGIRPDIKIHNNNREAKTALARGATMAGSATCSGEGGMIPDERRYSQLWYYQCIQSRYGFNPHHAQLADGIEVFIGQGQKVGMGGHLMGQKVTDQVAEMRTRIITSQSFSGTRILGAILFENTMDRSIDGMGSADYLWNVKGVVPFLKVDCWHLLLLF